MIVAIEHPESRQLYDKLRNAYNPLCLANALPIPPFEEWRGMYQICDHLYCRTMEGIIMSDELAFRPPSSHAQLCQQQQIPHASAALEREISTLPEGKNGTFRLSEAKCVTFSEASTATATSPGVTGITPDLAQGHINTPSISECSKASRQGREDLRPPDPSILPRCLAGYKGPESEPSICKFVVGDEPSDKHIRGQEALTITPNTHTVVTAEVIATGADAEKEKEPTRFPGNQDEMHMSESELDFDALAAEDWLDVTYAMLKET